MQHNDLYKFYPIMALIAVFLVYIWCQVFYRKDLQATENLLILFAVWMNLYLDTTFSFYLGLPFEQTNRITLYVSLVLTIFLIILSNKDFDLFAEITRLLRSSKTKENNENQRELPISYKEFENFAKSVQINDRKHERYVKKLLVLICFSVLCIAFLLTDLYVDLKKFQSFWEKSQILDFLNYPVFLYSLFKEIEKENKNWTYVHASGKVEISAWMKNIIV